VASAAPTAATAAPPRPEVRQIAVPDSIRSRSTLARIDYADTFVIAGVPPTNRTAEQWCRIVLDGAPRRVRARLVLGWSSLGLRLGPPWSADRVLGWAIRYGARWTHRRPRARL
jgi:hypothetical protein